ncbi:ABC transporter permease subunit [Marivita sp. XM-24bin2]|jgi:glycine betaine/proline transport system permease protein|uniref:ABC transporter permease n=1 Tax=unclassified Marivita TaxID=2632480 RepID=UPI000D7A3FA6|nr:ABC transporter permease subunit [Marivita sp. XM-24bin2]MCR9109661.1 ABC transporter permease subunit [Paracoccaceae bacterium]PWL34981.1 MAG: glycine/betaine ABC transporter permease [Marivita sp. XM-24bin2]
MSDETTEMRVTAASDIEVDRDALDQSIKEFAGPNGDYYVGAFHTIHDSTGAFPKTFNIAAALVGPVWASSRAIWGMFWSFLILEIIAWVQIGRGLWGNLGADFLARADQQRERMQERLDQAAAAADDETRQRFETLAENMQRAINQNLERAEAAQAEGFSILLMGLALLVIFKFAQGIYANIAYEKQYSRWRIDPTGTESGRSATNLVLGLVLTALIAPLIIYKFTVSNSLALLDEFPERQVSEMVLGDGGGTLFGAVASWMEARIDAAATAGGDVFDGIVAGVRTVLDGLTLALNGSPWPVVMLVIAVTAYRAAGPRVAIFTVAAMAYTALLGYWALAMETVALVGAAVILCVIIGIPLGVWFGKSQRAYRMAEPVLDLMQTLPAFVYLIPIIAFFGTGNPPGILATIIFGMPPVIRLTALGMRGVPESIKEAAVAFGASKWQLLKDVEIPLALPSIMAGVNQTILMCLSMVVIISLIGGGGLGQEILEALQFAAKGPGLLGGFAILFLAMVMDRVVQGAFKRADQK